jgi:hypothetical protein
MPPASTPDTTARSPSTRVPGTIGLAAGVLFAAMSVCGERRRPGVGPGPREGLEP